MAGLPARTGDRIYWDDDVDVEAGQGGQAGGSSAIKMAAGGASQGPPLRRERSNGSMSIRPHPRRNSIDASAALPIQYRTMSIDVDEYAQKQSGPSKKDKKTVVGK